MLKSNETTRLHVTKAGKIKPFPIEMTIAPAGFNRVQAIRNNQATLIKLGIGHTNISGGNYRPFSPEGFSQMSLDPSCNQRIY